MSVSDPIIERLLSHRKITSEDDKVNKIAKNMLIKLSNKDLKELEKSIVCQGKVATLCVVFSQSSDKRK